MLISSLLDLIAPRTCCICGRRLAMREVSVCTTCFLHMPLTDFLDNPYENDMAKMLWGKVRHFEKAYALMFHQPHSTSARTIYQLKYFKKPDVGVELGIIMGRKMEEKGFFGDIDCILPVPLARKRERERGYNQSLMIAEGLHEVSRLPVVRRAVRRVAFQKSQTTMGRLERFENVEKAFRLTNGNIIKGRHVLIVDDIITTGATACALARELEKAGDVRISVATVGYAGEWRSGATEKHKKQ